MDRILITYRDLYLINIASKRRLAASHQSLLDAANQVESERRRHKADRATYRRAIISGCQTRINWARAVDGLRTSMRESSKIVQANEINDHLEFTESIDKLDRITEAFAAENIRLEVYC